MVFSTSLSPPPPPFLLFKRTKKHSLSIAVFPIPICRDPENDYSNCYISATFFFLPEYWIMAVWKGGPEPRSWTWDSRASGMPGKSLCPLCHFLDDIHSTGLLALTSSGDSKQLIDWGAHGGGCSVTVLPPLLYDSEAHKSRSGSLFSKTSFCDYPVTVYLQPNTHSLTLFAWTDIPDLIPVPPEVPPSFYLSSVYLIKIIIKKKRNTTQQHISWFRRAYF